MNFQNLKPKDGWDALYISSLFAGLLFGLFLFGTTLYHSVWAPRSDEGGVPLAAAVPLAGGSPPKEAAAFDPIGEPARIVMPGISVDTKVIPVGMNKKGEMAAPKSFQEVGWYRHGFKPGDAGNAVMAGHLDNGLGLAGVFNRLNESKAGDEIIVYDAEGNAARFRVIGTELIDYTVTDTGRLFGPDGTARLNVITCDGAWIRDKKTYSERFIVYAVRIE